MYSTYQGYGTYEEPEYYGNYDNEYSGERLQRQREQERLAYELMLISQKIKVTFNLSEYDKMLLGYIKAKQV